MYFDENGYLVLDENGNEIPCHGELCYRGYNVRDLVKGFRGDGRFGFEETVYRRLFSELPSKEQLEKFKAELSEYRSLPSSFVRDMILKAPGKDLMNMISRSVLALYAYDDNPDDISIPNVLRQSLQLIAMFPLLAVYGYQSFQHYHQNKSLFIHLPKPEYSTAENILHLLREDSAFTPLEAQILDLTMVLHAEHGGGNNSTFTTHVVTSSGTDTYSSVAAALGQQVLRPLTKADIVKNIPALRESCGDRAVLRALHFVAENERVEKQFAALRRGDADTFFTLVRESGDSSYRYLQNVYTTKNVAEQGLSLALCLTESYLRENVGDRCAWRVHGGGFAGTIQAFVPHDAADGYARFMEGVFGAGSVHVLQIRPEGAIRLA